MRIKQTLKIEPLVEEKVFTVSEFIDFLNEILIPKRVVIQGEVGGKISEYPRFVIFNLLDKDKTAILNCFAWREKIEKLEIKLKEGMEIQVAGYPEVRKNKGELRFQVERIGLIGEGILKKQFEALKKKLAKERFFAPELKKPIPQFCQRIGLITSQYGRGAKKDFLTHLGNYGFEIYFYDARVEGMSAIDEICRATRWFNENLLACDVLVLTRGGGSWESLRPFNSEEVARAIFASKIPVIVGVGHEDDATIADLVADCRASTPTHAARILSDPWGLAGSQLNSFWRNILATFERTVENKDGELQRFQELLENLFKRNLEININRIEVVERSLNSKFDSFFKDFEKLKTALFNNFQIFQSSIKEKSYKIQELKNALIRESGRWLKELERGLQEKEQFLKFANPERRLEQGYSIVFDELSNKIIKDVNQLKVGGKTKTKFYRGSASSKIEKISKITNL